MTDSTVDRILAGTRIRLAGIEGEEATPRRTIRDRLLTIEGLAEVPAPESILDGYLYADTLALLYGPSGAGKSLQAIGWALHVGSGTWWDRRATVQAPVLYVVGEGVRGIKPRVDAWCAHHRLHGQGYPLHFVAGAVNVARRSEADELGEIAEELGTRLVVIDTLARCTVGADENSAKDMGAVVENLDAIRTRTGACVLVVHHSGKDASAGARGSSAIKAAVDVEIELNASGKLTVTKAKDWAPPAPVALSIEPVGDSAVIVRGGSDTEPATAAAVLEALRSIATADGVSASVWLASSEVSERSFYRARKWLVDTGQVRNVGTDKTPRYVPSTEGGTAT